MGSIKSVVKVMNFHSLLRVDKSRRKSNKYTAMESMLQEMIENIMYNRNIMIDHKIFRVDPSKPKLNIYIGSDMGFCANINTQVKKVMEQDDNSEDDQILIGRKLLAAKKKTPLLYMTRENFDKDNSKVTEIIENAIRNLDYSAITISYNKYINTSKVAMTTKQIFPLEEREEKIEYKEDFVLEDEPNELLVNMVVLFAKYTLEIVAAASAAAENINRQNVTTESLNKIEEREEIQKMEERRELKEKQFAKVLDNYTHSR